MYKFKINENDFYCGYGSDGTIAMTKTYNLDNLPIGCYHNGTKWVLDEAKFKEISQKNITKELEYHNNKIKELESQLESL